MRDLCQRGDEDVIALAWDHRADREQRNLSLARAACDYRLVGPGLRHAQTLGGNVEIRDKNALRRGARRDGMTGTCERGLFACMQPGRFARAQARFQCERVMHQRDQAVAFPQKRGSLGKDTKREPIDNDRTLPGEPCKLLRGFGTRKLCGPRKPAAEIDDVNLPANRCKLRDDTAVVTKTAGRCGKVARDGDDRFPHHNGASYEARANGDSAMVTRSAASSRPSRPNLPARAASATRSKMCRVKTSVVVLTPWNCGSSSRLR